MYQPKSNAVWFNLPGVVAAYQPIAAPDPFAARQNVAHEMRLIGRYTAMPGVLPTWSAAAGLSFNGTTQYLTTGIVPTSQAQTYLLRVSDVVSGNVGACGVIGDLSNSISIRPYPGGSLVVYNGAGFEFFGSGVASGVIALVGSAVFYNGVNRVGSLHGGCPNWAGESLGRPVFLGATNNNGTLASYWSGKIFAFAIASRTLTPAEVWLASRQMAYCEQNQDWNAWGRRRYYVPAAAGGYVGIYSKHGIVKLPDSAVQLS